jgi:hypothetical protein
MLGRVHGYALLVVVLLSGGITPGAGAGELVLDMSQIGPVDCGEDFVLSGYTCTIAASDEIQCIGDDYHGLLQMGWAHLIVDVSSLADITLITAVVETKDYTEESTVFGLYRDGEAISSVTNSTINDPELLTLNTVGVEFDSVQLSGLLLLLHEIRIEASGVTVERAAWSTVKSTYR